MATKRPRVEIRAIATRNWLKGKPTSTEEYEAFIAGFNAGWHEKKLYITWMVDRRQKGYSKERQRLNYYSEEKAAEEAKKEERKCATTRCLMRMATK